MGKTMKVAALTALKTVEIQMRPVPEPTNGEVLVKIHHAGICGSDLHYYEYGGIGTQRVQYPMILGHEIGGEVIELGKGVDNLKIGDLVAVEPQRTCGKCEFCKSGRYNLCPHVKFLATPPIDGAFAEYITHPADMVYKLQGNLDTVDGALMEPLAIGLRIANQVNAVIGETAVILGAGTVGLVTLMSLHARGISNIFVSDLVDNRLAMALELGASKTFNAAHQDVLSEVMEATHGKGADMVIEVAGSSSATQQSVDMVKRGGRIVLVGYAKSPINFDFRKLIMKEAYIITSRRYRNVYPVAINSVKNGLIPIRKLVTNKFPFSKIADAIEFSSKDKEHSIKTIIEF